MTPSSASTITVPTIEMSIDPRQPRRFEKKNTMFLAPSPPDEQPEAGRGSDEQTEGNREAAAAHLDAGAPAGMAGRYEQAAPSRTSPVAARTVPGPQQAVQEVLASQCSEPESTDPGAQAPGGRC